MKLVGFFVLITALSGCMVRSSEPFLPLLNPPGPGLDEIYLTAALSGIPVIEHGCVRVASVSGEVTHTVLWHRGTKLGRDSRGYFLRNAATGTLYRFGTRIAFGGGEMPPQWAAKGYPEVVQRCGPPYASGWLPK